MKKILIICALFLIAPAFADISPILKSTQKFDKSAEELYILGFNAIRKNKFEIVETQSRGGFILFKVGESEYLMSITDNMMKILPTSSDFSQGFSTQEKIFKTIEDSIGK